MSQSVGTGIAVLTGIRQFADAQRIRNNHKNPPILIIIHFYSFHADELPDKFL